MGIGFGGFNSGMPVEDIIAQLIAVERKPIQLIQQRKSTLQSKQGFFANVQARVNDLLSAVKKLTKYDFTGTSMFDALAARSSDDKIATATVQGNAAPQTLNLEVVTLPSQTRAVSLGPVGRFDNSTLLSEIGANTGTFTVFVNGTARSVTVDATEDMGTVLTRMASNLSDGGITFNAAIVDGKVQLTHDGGPGTTVSFGAGGDTGNFLARTNLLTAVNDGMGTITASRRNTTINLGAGVSDPASNIATPVTDGTFSINGVTFDTLKPDSTPKTLNELIDEINNSAAKVTASFNLGNNTFELKAKDTGSSLISLGDASNGGGTSNFLTTMGLITGGGNSAQSQTAGTNAEFVLNGVTMYATSALVDETVHGLSGVTLNLKKAQPGTTMQINIQKDQDSLKSAIRDVIDKYNQAISYIDQQTNAQNKAPLAGESRLTSLRNQLRTLFTSQVGALAGTAFDSLQQVGISTGAVSSGGTASPTLQFDEAKFDAAFSADPNTVRRLFIGRDLYDAQDGTAGDDNMKGILTQIQELISDQTFALPGGNTGFGALYNGPEEGQKGLFHAWKLTSSKRIQDLDKSIQKAEDRLLMKEKMLRQQFLAMDRLIGQFQNQGNALQGLINQLSSMNGK